MKHSSLMIMVLALTACGGSSGAGTAVPATTPATPSTLATPTNVVATVGDAQVTLDFRAASGTTAAVSYQATCTSGSASATTNGTSAPLILTGLANGQTYACTVTALAAGISSAPSASITATPQASAAGFRLSAPALPDSGVLDAAYTCDGLGSSPALSWQGAPSGTRSFALLMSTQPGDGSTKWNWVVHGIGASVTSLARDRLGGAIAGLGSDGPVVGYQPPCSQGPGTKYYTFTVYALSGTLTLATGQFTGEQLLTAITPLVLAKASLTVNVTRATNPTGARPACQQIRNAMQGVNVACDDTYAYLGSNGLASHAMMNGITASNLQVPIAQDFVGTNAWRIPLAPTLATQPTSVVDGPIGVAVNGVPIFNPCKQGGCQNGDTKVLGELDVCNGHAGRADDYHYHAAPTCLMATRSSSYWDTHPLGWALDGYAIYGYRDADGSLAERDAICGGNTKANTNGPAGYAYHVTDAAPYVMQCLRGVPSPDLAGQSSKYQPLRPPPVNPFAVQNMSLRTETDGSQVVQFSSARSFVSTTDGKNSFSNAAGTYQIRYVALSGDALQQALQGQSGKTACWRFSFEDASAAVQQGPVTYCR